MHFLGNKHLFAVTVPVFHVSQSLRWRYFVFVKPVAVVTGESMCYCKPRRCPSMFALKLFWSWQIFNFNSLLLFPCLQHAAAQMFATGFAAPGLPVAQRPSFPALRDDIIWPPCYPHQSCRLWWVCVSLFLFLRQHVSSLILCPPTFCSFCTLSERTMLVK